MSDNIPFELQSEIMKMLPVKSLLQFRSVCKAWKSLIDSSDFILHHISQQQHLLVRYIDAATSEQKYVSVVDDDDDTDTFPQHKVSVNVPLSANMRHHYTIVDTSHGLFCLFGDRQPKALIWNPCIRKSVAVTVPVIAGDDHEDRYITVLGFGVCRKTKDPKIVKITIEMESVNPWQVEVFTLSTRAWKGPYNSSNLPRKSLYDLWDQVVVDGCLYWLANDGCDKLIVSFDLTSEEFREVNLPDSLANSQCSLSMYKLRESLVVVKNGLENNNLGHHVWMMKDGVPNLFEKLFTISRQSLDVTLVRVRGFRKTGEPLVELQAHPGSTGVLAGYEPSSKSISNLGINGTYFFVYSYMETLLLL